MSRVAGWWLVVVAALAGCADLIGASDLHRVDCVAHCEGATGGDVGAAGVTTGDASSDSVNAGAAGRGGVDGGGGQAGATGGGGDGGVGRGGRKRGSDRRVAGGMDLR